MSRAKNTQITDIIGIKPGTVLRSKDGKHECIVVDPSSKSGCVYFKGEITSLNAVSAKLSNGQVSTYDFWQYKGIVCVERSLRDWATNNIKNVDWANENVDLT